jgi:hypothetical protein
MSSRVIQGLFPGGRPGPLQPTSPPQVALPRSGPSAGVAGNRPATQRYGGGEIFPVDVGRVHLASGAGRPLPEELRGGMEAAFGADFSAVRVHIGPQPQRIRAIAFTTGNDIYFAPGRFQPETAAGRQLLGHELAHVLQQRQGRVRNPPGAGFAVVHDRALEAEADRLGQRAAACTPVAQRCRAGAAAARHSPPGRGIVKSPSASPARPRPAAGGARFLQRMEERPRTKTGDTESDDYVPRDYEIHGLFAQPPEQRTTPVQGWKLHVTASAGNLGDIARRVLPLLRGLGVAHKIVKTGREFDAQQGTQAGKFITIYPSNDAQAVQIVGMLGAVLSGKQGAEIRGDERLGPLTYARYALHRPYCLGKDVTAEALAAEGWSQDKDWQPKSYRLFEATSEVMIVGHWEKSDEHIYIAEQIAGHVNVVCVLAKRGVVATALRDPTGKWVIDRRDEPNPYDFPSLPPPARWVAGSVRGRAPASSSGGGASRPGTGQSES